MIRRSSQKRSRLGMFGQRAAAETEPASPRQTYWRRAALFAALLIITLTVTRMPVTESKLADVNIDKQVVATQRYQAAFFFESVDLQKTEEARAAAAAKVPSTYRVRRDRVRAQLSAAEKRINALHELRPSAEQAILAALRASSSDETPRDITAKALATVVSAASAGPLLQDGLEPGTLAVWLTPDPVSLPERVFDEQADNDERALATRDLVPNAPGPFSFSIADSLARIALGELEYVLSQGVRSADITPEIRDRRVVVLHDDPGAGSQLSEEMALAELGDPAQAAELLQDRIENSVKLFAKEQTDPDWDWGKMSDAAYAIVASAVSDTLQYDEEATNHARQQARNAVEPILKEIQAHEIIQAEGERWTAQSRSDVHTYLKLLESNSKPSRQIYTALIAHLLFAALAIACIRRAITLFGPKAVDERDRMLYLALLLTCVTLIAGRIVSYFEPSGLILPVAAPAILMAILVNLRLAGLLTVSLVGLVSAQYGYDWRLVALGASMSLAGAFSIYKVRRRSDMTAATLKATFAGLVAMTAIILATDSLFSESAVRQLSLIAMNGVICVFVVPGVLSPLERLFGITTDIQLLEYSDLNNDVLGRLAMEVPATWSHSLMMGQLAETVAEAIGANGLLARVCAYYHDIGKMRRPEYFTENQTGFNIHDELAPRLSARAIAAHVTYGAELAREFHLPKPIVDGILEHHGTTRIGFFYQRALELAKHDDVREEDFRYPGPKPQRRETAILMICDAVESGVRSIKNPNEERVREFIDKIIAARAADRQFDECDLTMKDLDTIAKLLTKRVLGAMHTRIAYPDIKKDEKGHNIIQMPGGSR